MLSRGRGGVEARGRKESELTVPVANTIECPSELVLAIWKPSLSTLSVTQKLAFRTVLICSAFLHCHSRPCSPVFSHTSASCWLATHNLWYLHSLSHWEHLCRHFKKQLLPSPPALPPVHFHTSVFLWPLWTN